MANKPHRTKKQLQYDFRRRFASYAASLPSQAQRIEEASTQALFEEAVAVYNDSQRNVPVDTGRLRASALITPESANLVSITYGTNYALTQHEGAEFKHVNGEYRYLANAMDHIREGFTQRVSERIRQLTKLEEKK